MNIVQTAEQAELRSILRRMLGGRGSATEAPPAAGGQSGFDPALWSALVEELGVLEIAASGDESAVALMAVVAEEAGRALSPVPLVSSMLAVYALGAASGDRSSSVDALVSGEKTGTVVSFPWSGPERPAFAARRDGGRWVLTGSSGPTMYGDLCDVFVVVAAVGDGDAVFVVDRLDGGVGTVVLPGLDESRRLADVVLEDAPGGLIADGSDAVALVRAVLDLGAVLLAAEAVGGARRCLETTLEYVTQREQFGRQIGSFQALKHRLADRHADLEASAALVALAAGLADDPSADAGEVSVAASAAKSHATDMFRAMTAETLQMHGGIGYTWEHAAHLYFKRAHVLARVWGDAAEHRERIARILAF